MTTAAHVRLALRLGWRDARHARSQSVLAVTVITVAGAFSATAATAIARMLAPGSTLGSSSGASTTATATLDDHVVMYLVVFAVVAATAQVALVAPVFLAGFRRQVAMLGRLAAVGASRRHLAERVLAPAVILGVTGGLAGSMLGLVAGTALTPAAGAPSAWQTLLPVLAVLATTLLSAMTSVTCALYPAVQAARLAPAEAVRGHGARTWRVPTAALAVAGAVLCGLGATGFTHATRHAAVSGVAAATAAAMAGVSLLAASAWHVVAAIPVARSHPARYALRDRSRNRGRFTSPVCASALVVAALTAGVVFSSVTSTQASDSHVPVAPAGAVLLPGTTAEDAALAVGTVAPVTMVVPVQAADGMWMISDPHGGPPIVADTRPTALSDGQPLIATPELVDAFALPAPVKEALAGGSVVVRESLGAAVSAGHLTMMQGGRVWTVPAAAVLGADSPAAVLVPPGLMQEVGWPVRDVGTVVVAQRPLTASDGDLIAQQLDQVWPQVETGSPVRQDYTTQVLLAVLAAVLTLAIIALVSRLSAAQARADGAVLAAVGAPRRFLLRVRASNDIRQVVAACLVGLPAGAALGWGLITLRAHAPATALPPASTIAPPLAVMAATTIFLASVMAFATSHLLPRIAAR